MTRKEDRSKKSAARAEDPATAPEDSDRGRRAGSAIRDGGEDSRVEDHRREEREAA